MLFFNRRTSAVWLTVRLALCGPARAADPDNNIHRLGIQITANEPGLMTMALNNAANVARHYGETGDEFEIELVAYGPGLHMLREDTSPVKARLKSISESLPNMTFSACGNTITEMQKLEKKPIPIFPGARIVKTGVVRIIELQEQGWSYLRP